MTTELRRRARDLALSGKYKKAAALYEQLLARASGDAPSVLRLAELRRRIGDHTGARTAYQQAITLYLDSGWDEKALAVESALEHLGHAAPIARRLRPWVAAAGKWLARVGDAIRAAASRLVVRFGAAIAERAPAGTTVAQRSATEARHSPRLIDGGASANSQGSSVEREQG